MLFELMLDKFKNWARKLLLEIRAIYLAAKDSRTPRLARLLAFSVAAYAFSPIDLIPDFIPVLGLLDDLIIVPVGIALVIRLIPQDLMTSFREQAKALAKPSSNWTAGIVIVGLWVVAVVVVVRMYIR